ncbi:Protein of unknown function [Paenibacillus polysaccharolyticus]|uniref:DUF3105 domain-containing protein n=1 Tax=Paenibacillus polysaccharolyticus TaxID=582692 RepID=A0A1G5L3F4_9BACL|nr:DUF3105 domain-containing protein [Paenibacillus polysaccharolyticus]SCZ06898.1 Protein of unknown function [Paenibacillus polysaccharolyticus]
MDMTHMDHMQMEQQTGTSYLWLIVGAALLLLSIAAYIWASRTRGKILSHMKKNERAAIQKKSRSLRLTAHALIAVSIVAFGVFFLQGAGKTYDVADLPNNATINVTDDKYYGATHTEEPIQYEMKIPTSGPHNPHDIQFGFYTDFPGYPYLVHNMEHGDIIIYYRENASDELKEHLQYLAKFRQAGSGILAVPNKDIPDGSEIVVTAWTKTMKLDKFDDAKVGTFIHRYINQGPEKIPPSIRQGGGTM